MATVKANIYKADFLQPAKLKPIKVIETIDEKLSFRRFNPNADPPIEQIVLRIENKNIGSLQNIVSLTGLPKQGKSKFSAAIAAAALCNYSVFGFDCRLPADRKRVAYIGTDESSVDFYNTISLIRRLSASPANIPNLDAFNVRRDEPGDIIKMIHRYLTVTPECSVMVIDNVADLLMNYNDEGQSKRVINFLKYWTDVYNIMLVPLLHLGKGNLSSLGHLGAGLDRYSQSIFKVEKNTEQGNYVLTGDRLRSAGSFTPLCIYYNTMGPGWEQTFYQENPPDPTHTKKLQERASEINKQDHTLTVSRIFTSESVQGYGMLINGIVAHYAKGRNWAKECFRYLIKEGLIYEPEPGHYTNINQARLFIKS